MAPFQSSIQPNLTDSADWSRHLFLTLNYGWDFLKPDDAIAYYNRGIEYYKQGEHDRAIRDYTKAIELKPDRPDYYSRRGDAYWKKRDLDQAIRNFTKAIELRQDYAEAYVKRGISYDNKGDDDLAMRDHMRAIELRPDYADAYYSRAIIHYRLKAYDKAWADVKKCRKLGFTPDPEFIQQLTKDSGRSE